MFTMQSYFVYILASKQNGTLYIGVTGDLIRRIREHKDGLIEGFTKKYHVHRLVYFEQHSHIEQAIEREKQLKKMESTVENQFNRKRKSDMERFV